MIDWLSLTVELATEHLSGDGHLQHVAGELAVSVRVINVGSTLENLTNQTECVKSQIHQM